MVSNIKINAFSKNFYLTENYTLSSALIIYFDFLIVTSISSIIPEDDMILCDTLNIYPTLQNFHP